MPSMVVRMKPEGSLSPGIMNFAITPAMKPMMIVQSMPISMLPVVCLNVTSINSCCGQTAVRCVLVDGCRKLARQSRQDLFLRKSGLLFELCQNVGPDRLLQFRRRDILVRALVDPGFGLVALAVLIEPFEQLADPAVEQAANPG